MNWMNSAYDPTPAGAEEETYYNNLRDETNLLYEEPEFKNPCGDQDAAQYLAPMKDGETGYMSVLVESTAAAPRQQAGTETVFYDVASPQVHPARHMSVLAESSAAMPRQQAETETVFYDVASPQVHPARRWSTDQYALNDERTRNREWNDAT